VETGPHPGEIFLKDAQPIMINGDRDSIFITVTNESTELISIGSHFHFVEANRHLAFDRTLAYGMRLVKYKILLFVNFEFFCIRIFLLVIS
jgi:urease beta subunit